ncbi:hypothetical protein [Arthrobacter castelli]|uniref:hypothetical protein n=1 Tax=Arthrobacter castelli TaxID=271431 RepID=UPI000423CE61|nr:hypothetical protein [Arthrobacter castelli]
MNMDARTSSGMQAEALLIWWPLLLRALVAAIFGAFTIFWQDPGPAAMAVSTGLYLVGSAAAIYLLRSRLSGPETRSKSEKSTQWLLRVNGAALAVGGLLSVMFQTPGMYVLLVATTLLVGGIVEIVLGFRHRHGSGLGRDWLITGAVNTGAALLLVLLPLFTPLAPHALLGVVGGSAIIIAVLLILAGLGYRHDAAPGADTGTGTGNGPEAVN